MTAMVFGSGSFRPGSAGLLAVPVVLTLLGALFPGTAAAEIRCRTLRYAFQTDCFEPPCDKPKRKLGDRLDLGPQIAVWVEAATQRRFVDTVLVTNLTARYGIGNRPGLADLPSGPKHPYGKRLMTLPIWAFARGKLYPQIVMQDGHEEWMGFHESISTPDPYFCRPMGLQEVDVDAITCPTKVFNSAKGRAAKDRPMVPYPPRNDLVTFSDRDCDDPSMRSGDCPKSAEGFAGLNDLDAVAGPTPPFDRVFEGRWTIAPGITATEDYMLMVEVNREFDQNASHRYPAYNDTMLSNSGFTQTGLPNNLGQPSVVYRVPFRVDSTVRFANTAVAHGYGKVDGSSGAIAAMDATISSSPGSGEGRLKIIKAPWADAPAGDGRVFVRLDDCREPGSPAENECDPMPAPPAAVTELAVLEHEATTAKLSFRHSGDEGRPVLGYEIRLLHGKTATEENFLEGVPKAVVDPAEPGTVATFMINELKPLTEYVVAVRAFGRCGTHSALSQRPFATKDLMFQQLSGCFIATAAYGSPLAPAVQSLRTIRDGARGKHPVAAAAIDLYERSSPPLAGLIRTGEASRALVRTLLGPVLELAGPPPAAGNPPTGAPGFELGCRAQ
jgi:hypothetical protein